MERRRRNLIIAAAVLIPVLIVVIWALTVAGSAGFLPWQPEPTRIPVTPFADLPNAQGAGGTPAP
jgi:hypothetical protein